MVEALAKWIRSSRKNAGLNQEQLAEKLGVTQPLISYWETGEATPNSVMTEKLSAILGKDLD